ncbi:MAG: hypothetical protein KatS3mg064_1303 [Tepidiforma sp.]|nr:matrixin family metalloprotease [Tepidiforma sp.]GIW18146.1 MAG: hypothetical protein KatS3mg064_1303 [Tepidiforma sp.]
MRFALPAAALLLVAASLAGGQPAPAPARAGPGEPPSPAASPAFTETRLAFLLPGPAGPLVLEIAAIAPAGAAADPAALAASLLAANPGAVPLAPREASAAYVLGDERGGVRWRVPVVPWRYNPAGATPFLDPKAALEAVSLGADGWRFAGGTPVQFVYDGETATPTGCRGDPGATGYAPDGENVVGWGPIPGGYLGYACWVSSPFLVQGTPFFELVEFDIVLRPDFQYTPELLRALALHEFGHALGLGHSDRCPGAAMCGGPASLDNIEPQADDIAGLIALYGRAGPAPLPPRALLPLVARD